MGEYKPSICQSCGFSYMRFTEEPCKNCNEGDNWISKVSKVTNPVKIDCAWCRYEEVDANEDPCCHCVGGSEWKFDTFPDESGDYPFEDAQESPEIDAEGAKIDDPVDHPSHYTSLPIEAIKIIKNVLTEAFGEKGFEAYCFGNELKYRLRAGFKGPAQEDIGKALKYLDFRQGNDMD